jgi:hypothetical protein
MGGIGAAERGLEDFVNPPARDQEERPTNGGCEVLTKI